MSFIGEIRRRVLKEGKCGHQVHMSTHKSSTGTRGGVPASDQRIIRNNL
jgi:hypothetical protein